MREALNRLLRAIDAEQAAWTAYLNTPLDRGGRSGPQGKAVKAWHDAKAEVYDARAALDGLGTFSKED